MAQHIYTWRSSRCDGRRRELQAVRTHAMRGRAHAVATFALKLSRLYMIGIACSSREIKLEFLWKCF